MADDALQGLRGTETVLVVEDVELLRNVVRRMLRLLGYTVLDANDAPSALALLDAGPRPHLLLTDIRLPGASGPDLARAVREIVPGCEILFMTGYGGADLPEDSTVPVLEKPFTHAALARSVRDALDKRA